MKKLLALSLVLLTAVGGASALSMPTVPSKETAIQALYTAYDATKAVPMRVVDSAMRHPYVCIAVGCSIYAAPILFAYNLRRITKNYQREFMQHKNQ